MVSRLARAEIRIEPRERATLALVVVVCAASLSLFGAAVATVQPAFTGTPALALALLALGVAAQRMQIDLYGRGKFVPTAVTVVAGALLLGPAGGGLLAAGVYTLGERLDAPLRRRCFNTSSNLLVGTMLGSAGGALSALIAALIAPVAEPLAARGIPSDLLVAGLVGLILGGALFTVTAGLVTGVMAVSEGGAPGVIYRDRMGWQAPHTLAYAVIGAGMATAAAHLGPLSLFLFAIPMGMLRLVSRQLVEGTRQHVETIQATRDRLQGAYDDLREREVLLTTMVDELEGANRAIIRAFSAMLDARDSETEGHSERVVGHALVLARALDVPADALGRLELGAILHDIGKVGVPDAILLKPGPLDPHEWAIMREHPIIGAGLVRDIPQLGAAVPIIRHHHERWDGGGYPDGLAGEAIPHAARIFSVADVYDALVSNRPYRAGLPPEEAAAIIRRGAGTQFDPTVVAAFEECFLAGNLGKPAAEVTSHDGEKRAAVPALGRMAVRALSLSL